jgi:hypothetical protein
MNDRNDILEELWAVRKRIEEENNNDLDAIFDRFHKQQLKSPEHYFSGKPVRIERLKAA